MALAVLLLLQMPPGTTSLRVSVRPTHTLVEPIIGPGVGLTLIVVVVIQPVGKVKVITVLPIATPVTTPVVDPTVAMVVALLVQVPEPEASLRASVEPMHTASPPEIGAGSGVTVTTLVMVQPVVVSVYLIVSVAAVAPAVTTPVEELTEAIVGVTLLHVPPGVPSVKVVVVPSQMLDRPAGGAGNGLTVMTTLPAVLTQPVVALVALTV